MIGVADDYRLVGSGWWSLMILGDEVCHRGTKCTPFLAGATVYISMKVNLYNYDGCDAEISGHRLWSDKFDWLLGTALGEGRRVIVDMTRAVCQSSHNAVDRLEGLSTLLGIVGLLFGDVAIRRRIWHASKRRNHPHIKQQADHSLHPRNMSRTLDQIYTMAYVL